MKKKIDLMKISIFIIAVAHGVSIAMLTKDMDNDIMSFIFYIFFIFVWLYLGLIIHEAGHLICGLISGYKFLSFRISFLMLMKVDNKYKFSIKNIAGTGGQCVMSPPDLKDNKIPYKLFNAGGYLFNLLTAIICLIIFIALDNVLFKIIFLEGFFFNLILFINNGITYNNDFVSNDAYNIQLMNKDILAQECFYKQLKVVSLQAAGNRLKDMPSELFDLPDNYDKHNQIITTIAVFNENRLLDSGLYEDCYKAIEDLLSDSYSLAGIYENLLLNDKALLQIMLDKPLERSIISSKKMQDFRKSMSNYLPIMICDYAITKFVDNDLIKANDLKEKILKNIEKCTDKGEALCNRALLEAIDNKI